MTPKTTPKTASNTKAIRASLMVTGKARPITSMTSCPEKVLPKSRVSAFFRNS